MKKEDKKKKYVIPTKVKEAFSELDESGENLSKEAKKLKIKKAALKKMRSQSYGD